MIGLVLFGMILLPLHTIALPLVTVVSDQAAEGMLKRADEIVHRQMEAFVEHQPELAPAFSFAKLVVRVVGPDQKLSEMPEATCWPFSLVPFDKAYGATCPRSARDDHGDVYRVLFVRFSPWVEITLIHELTHLLHFSSVDADFEQVGREVSAIFSESSCTVDLSNVHENENLAYKAQYYMTGAGAFLERARDPAFALLKRWFGSPLFPELKTLAEKLHPACAEEPSATPVPL
jgi:hypothetical protein